MLDFIYILHNNCNNVLLNEFQKYMMNSFRAFVCLKRIYNIYYVNVSDNKLI